MATRFVDQATQQLGSLYDQQTQATQAQLPAIQRLYDTLLTGLEGQRATETQNILESASARGVLRSSMPVDLQSQLGAALLAQRGQLESQRAQEISGVQRSLADIGLQRSQAITSLADALQARDLQERQFQLQKEQADRDYQLDLQRFEAEKQAAAAGSGGGGGAPSNDEIFAAELAATAGNDGKVSPGVYNALKQQWVASGYGDYKAFHDKFWRFANESHWWDYYYN